jgi:hypothetical protein
VNGLALAAAITPIVAVVATSGVAVWTFQQSANLARESAQQSANLAREARTHQRVADSYLEVLRLVEREGQWVEATTTNWKLTVEEAEANPPYVHSIFHTPGFEFERVKVPKPAVTDRAIIAANLAAFGSPNVRQLYQVWRSAVTEIDEGRVTMIYGLDVDDEGHQPGLGEVKELLDVLQPKQSAARQALADAIAAELGHR